MELTFAFPWGGLVALAAVVPLAVLALSERRTRWLRSILELPQPRLRTVFQTALALAAVSLLLGAAVAQPELQRRKTRYVRTDAAAFFVLDTSRSMLAADSANGTTRFERATRAALRLRSAIPEVPAGIVSMTDRVLPHLFPTARSSPFVATLQRAIGVERPPPALVRRTATTLFSLTGLAVQNYFADSAKRRVAVVLTDGESSPFEETEFAQDFRQTHIKLVFVQFWHGNERVFGKGGKAEGYRPDPGSRSLLEALSATTGAAVFSENDLGGATAAIRNALGTGPRVAHGRDESALALAPYAALAVLFPLAFLLWRRNLWGLIDPERLRSARAKPSYTAAPVSTGRP